MHEVIQNHKPTTQPIAIVRLVLLLACFFLTKSPFAQPNDLSSLSPTAIEKIFVSPISNSPYWSDLTPSEKFALAPLEKQWSTINTAQKRKWLALSKNFANLSTQDQQKLQGRANDWAMLSPQQRAQARINFSDSKQLTSEGKIAKWEAYLSLSPDEKQKLAKAVPVAPTGAAPSVKKVESGKLISVPNPKSENLQRSKIETELVAPRTLLPLASQAAINSTGTTE